MNPIDRTKGGRREGQKFKTLLIWNYLLKATDENHALSASDICERLALYGIKAERHAVSRDIKALLELLETDADLAAEDELEERELLNYVIEYDPKLHGYKISQRPYEFDDLRLLAECVRAARFISKGQEDSLLSAIEGLCSEHQIEELKNEVYLVGRSKTSNKYIMSSMLTINRAIRKNQKIGFKYQKYVLQNGAQQIERRKGARYIVSPYKLIINEGNYYLLAYDGQRQDIRTYRLDRMKEVRALPEGREGTGAFAEIDLKTYTQRVFSMFGGRKERVSVRFVNSLLDTVVDRFGTGGGTSYFPDGKEHFIVRADIEISDQFYSWICGFRKRAVILEPPEAVEGMKKFLKDITERYQG